MNTSQKFVQPVEVTAALRKQYEDSHLADDQVSAILSNATWHLALKTDPPSAAGAED